ncbi:MAG: helix-turn-helix domain-containing protein [Clostridiales bacterium]|nr:helix-turn-helix domain-containing protein [Clostridiales bacterium]
MDLFKSIVKGLDDSIEFEKGQKVGRRNKITIAPVELFSNNEIKEIRNTLELTQSAFALLVGVNTKTVEAWETGTNKPNGSARRLLGLLKIDNNLPKHYHLIEYKL